MRKADSHDMRYRENSWLTLFHISVGKLTACKVYCSRLHSSVQYALHQTIKRLCLLMSTRTESRGSQIYTKPMFLNAELKVDKQKCSSFWPVMLPVQFRGSWPIFVSIGQDSLIFYCVPFLTIQTH
jgi:hypothetical protein